MSSDSVIRSENGSIDLETGKIRLDINAGARNINELAQASLPVTLAHELTHYLKRAVPELYQEYQQVVLERLVEKGMDIDGLLRQEARRAPGTTDLDTLMEEVIANASGLMLKDSAALQQIADKNPTLFDKIREWVKEFIDRIRKNMNKLNAVYPEAAALTEAYETTIKVAEHIQAAFDKAFVEADARRAAMEQAKDAKPQTPANRQAQRVVAGMGEEIPAPAQDAGKAPENANTEGGERWLYSERLSYNEQLNQLWEGKLDPKYTHIRIMQNTPEILIKHAGAKDKPVMMKRHSFELELFEEGPREGNYHGLGYDVMEKLPDMMSNPALIYKRSDGRIIEISRYSSPEKNLLLSIELDSEFRYVGDDGESWGDFNIVITAFNPKDRYLKGQLSRDGNEFLYPTKKEDISSAMSGLFAYPGDNKDTSSIDNIPPTNDGSQVLLSTRDSAGRDLSPEQQEFFKDSQVRDEQGNLMPVYHQTDTEFTVFDPKRKGGAGEFDSEMPSGIFMKPTSADIGLRGDIQMALYANISNPLEVQDRAELAEFYRNNILGFAEAEEEIRDVDQHYEPLIMEAESKSEAWYRENYDDIVADKYTEDELEQHIEGEIDEILNDWNAAGNAARAKAKGLIDAFFEASDYDGLIVREDAGSGGRRVETYVAFNPEQVKATDNTSPTSDPDIRYSFRGYAPPMYSRLQMEIEALKDDAKLGADSVIAYLRKRGVKAEEIRWSGIQAFLQGKKSVTKAELMEFVQGNELRVEDVSSTAPIVFDINEAEETITLSDHRSDWMHVVPGDDGRYYDEISGLEFDSFDEAIESAERAEAELREGEEYPETRYRAMPAYEKPPARPMDGYYRAIRLC